MQICSAITERGDQQLRDNGDIADQAYDRQGALTPALAVLAVPRQAGPWIYGIPEDFVFTRPTGVELYVS